jgi:transcriptional regulator of arginine metabolism
MNIKTSMSNTARQALVASLIKAGGVESQSHLIKLLSKEGVKVTQATISRDLEELRAVRQRNAAGDLHYQLPESFNSPSTGYKNLILTVTSSGNLAVVKTPSGGAQLLASAIDRNGLDGVLKNVIGTIAGDDTVLVVSKSSTGGAVLASAIEKFASKSRKGR